MGSWIRALGFIWKLARRILAGNHETPPVTLPRSHPHRYLPYQPSIRWRADQPKRDALPAPILLGAWIRGVLRLLMVERCELQGDALECEKVGILIHRVFPGAQRKQFRLESVASLADSR